MKKIIFLILITTIIFIGIDALAYEFSYEDFIEESSQYAIEGIDLTEDADKPQNLGSKLLNFISSRVWTDVKAYLNSFLAVISILIIASILSIILSDKENTHIGLYGIYILCAIILSQSFFDISSICTKAIDDLSDYMNVSFAGYSALLISSGYGVTASYMQGIFAFISGAASFSFSKIIIPILYSCGIAALANGVIQSDDITLLIKAILKFVKYFLGIILTLISAIMGFTGFTAATADGLAVKTAKYAVSNFVPIVGSCLADTLNNVVYTSVVMKNTVGYIGFITVIMICLMPIIKIFTVSFMIKLISIMASVLHHKKMTELSDTLSSVAVSFGAILALISIVFIIMIGVIISVGG